MNSKFVASALIAAASLVSVSAFAAGADGSVDIQPTLTSNTTRAEVRAQIKAAQPGAVVASNLVDGGTTLAVAPVSSERSRADVRSEAVHAGVSYNAAPGRA
ncbi:hypothetical protein [Polaromonas sp. SM01]|uniref:hypothetical protein n=1 Tax=Polaromonas sp. SM01 TaxID=3085630 RepID=UPI0029818A08|nr:hypothetical protein [Polaromonas sp. SM01]MDW5443527.1 hypothetical protein [Polaromonas sp. SM01]